MKAGYSDDEGGDFEGSSASEGGKDGVTLFDFDAYGRRIDQLQAAQFGHRRQRQQVENDDSSTEPEDDGNDEQGDDGGESDVGEDQGEDIEALLLEENMMTDFARMQLNQQDDGTGDDSGQYAWIERSENNLERISVQNPQKILRTWESSLFLTAFQNIESAAHCFFLVITFGHIDPTRKIQGALRRRILYTPAFFLRSGEYKVLAAPMPVWPHKLIPLSYGGLGSFGVKFDLWALESYSFNTLYAEASMTFEDVVNGNSDTEIVLTRSLKKKSKRFEVLRIRCTFLMSEIFDFDLFFESWSFSPGPATAPFITGQQLQLMFRVPRGAGNGWQTVWSASSQGFWPAPVSHAFVGTMQELRDAYFTVKVFVVQEKRFRGRRICLGTALLPLGLVTVNPLIKGPVKQLAAQAENFLRGEVVGNVRCFMRSTGIKGYEDPQSIRRPEQPLAGAAVITQLDMRQQYLVVRLHRCENLPAADADAGTSDPLVRVTWDSMTNETSSQIGTLRPVWNQCLYFPVRLLDKAERTNEKLIGTSLVWDLQSKGNISLEVWDKETTSSSLLGGCECRLSAILNQGKLLKRSLVTATDNSNVRLPDGRPANFAYERDNTTEIVSPLGDDEGPAAKPRYYEIMHDTLVYQEENTPLIGGTIESTSLLKPTISFECFFLPPFPESLKMPDDQESNKGAGNWEQFGRRFERYFTKFSFAYESWFPDAPTNRRFVCTAEHPQSRQLHALPAFLSPLALPERLRDEGEILHWVANMQWTGGGTPVRWLSPSYFLITRRGGVHDHVLLLCACLLGLNFDAYVVKGTIDRGKAEHYWVMTRHAEGWVVFWEATTRVRYPLPQRWQRPLPPTAPIDPDMLQERWSQLQSASQSRAAPVKSSRAERAVRTEVLLEDDAVPDIMLKEEEVDISTWERTTAKPGRQQPINNRQYEFEAMKVAVEAELETLPLAPMKELLIPGETLAFVPYSTVEVVFNNKQLWGNLRNHHPATIHYDLEDAASWKPFLEAPPSPIDLSVFIAPSTRDQNCKTLQSDVAGDLAEAMLVHRMKRGLNTQFDHNEATTEKVGKLLDLLEFRLRLDRDHDPGPPPGHEGWTRWAPFTAVESGYTGYTPDLWYEPLMEQMNQGQNYTDMYSDSDYAAQIQEIQMPEYQQNGEPQQLLMQPQAVHGASPMSSSSSSLQLDSADGSIPRRRSSNDDERWTLQMAVSDPDIWRKQVELMYEEELSSSSSESFSSGASLESSSFHSVEQSAVEGEVRHLLTSARETPGGLSISGSAVDDVANDKDDLWDRFMGLYDRRLSTMNSFEGNEVPQALKQTDAHLHRDSTMKFSVVADVAPAAPAARQSQNALAHGMVGDLDYEEFNTRRFEGQVAPSPAPSTQQRRAAPMDEATRRLLEPPEELEVVFSEKGTVLDASKIGIGPGLLSDPQKKVTAPSSETSEEEEAEEEDWWLGREAHPCIFPVPVWNPTYAADQRAKWDYYYSVESTYFQWQKSRFPVRPRHSFCGFPVHLSVTDLAQIRAFLLTSRRFKRIVDLNVDAATFIILCRVYPLMGGVVSLWLFIGCEVPWLAHREARQK